MNFIKHFKTITKHKWIVMKLCFKCRQYRRGLMHDLSKYSIAEFASSAKYFQGDKSPINAEKIKNGYSIAWQHHMGHNPHHWEYWIDYSDTGEIIPIKIPYNYVVEMICDWVGAGIVYSKENPDFEAPYEEPLNYYNKVRAGRHFHKDTEELILKFLNLIKDYGINSFCYNVSRNPGIKFDYNRK